MTHDKSLEIIRLNLIDELDDKQKSGFREHVAQCSECREEIEEFKKLLSIFDEVKLPKPDEELLQEARMELRGLLRREASKKSVWSFLDEKITSSFNSGLRIAFSGAIILLLGLFAGYIFFHSNQLQAPQQ